MDSRVSVKSLGLSCITAALDIYPYTCITLEFVESYLSAKDPKLCSQAVMVCLRWKIVIIGLSFFSLSFSCLQLLYLLIFAYMVGIFQRFVIFFHPLVTSFILCSMMTHKLCRRLCVKPYRYAYHCWSVHLSTAKVGGAVSEVNHTVTCMHDIVQLRILFINYFHYGRAHIGELKSSFWRHLEDWTSLQLQFIVLVYQKQS